MMCEGCKKSGCTECVKSYIGEHFGDCKECCEKAGSPDGNGWESEEEEEEEDYDWEYLCPNLHWGGQYGCDLCGCDLCFNGCDLCSNVKDIDNNNMRKEWLNKCNKYCYKLHKKWLEEKMARIDI
jgi:hypothetical protein